MSTPPPEPAIIIDSNEITNSIDSNREEMKKQKNAPITLPLLLDPEFAGAETNPITGEKCNKFVLKTLEIAKIPYAIQTLDFADYIIVSIDEYGDPIIEIIERKTMTDLIGSFTATASVKKPGKSGSGKKGKVRIDDEITKCLNGAATYFDNARVSLLIEDFYNCRFDFSEKGLGVWIQRSESFSKNKTDRKGKPIFNFVGYSKRLINPASVIGKIDAIAHRGVNIIRCGGASHAYRIVMGMINRKATGTRVDVAALRRKPSHMQPDEEILFHLQGTPGIAGGLSIKLIKKYPKLIDLYNAIASTTSASDIGIKGFGQVKFDAFRGMLTRKYAGGDDGDPHPE